MHLNLCRSCGGELDRQGNFYVCRYCGNRWMIDAAEDVHVVDRANAWAALRDCDFERAAELFENIILKDREDHEAYWGRALARAGIIYVNDIDENKKVPTCNGISENSFSESRDVKKAVELAPAEIAASYIEQAEKIEAIRAEWFQKASKEKPYDVFICFKDSDRERGLERTDDSYEAQSLYHALTAEGYRVFFSRESLRDKVSEHYEPYIYNAIRTAKVMIVFGEKPEYFNAVWVKNEWVRFRNMMVDGQKHPNSLVVAYKGFDPSDLPTALSSRQCMNASEFTFLEDLKEHIRSIIEMEVVDRYYVPHEPNGGPAPSADRYTPVDLPPAKSNAPKSEIGKHKKKLAIIAALLAFAITLAVILPNIGGNGIKEPITSKETTELIEITDDSEINYSEGLEFEANGDGATCTVTRIGDCKDTDVVIPPTSPDGLKVTSIGDNAFSDCSSLTSVTIPDSVTNIGGYAFSSCSSLTSVTIGNSVTSIDDEAFYDCSSLESITVDTNNVNYKSINGNLYSKDGKTLIQYAIGKPDTSFTIPDSVTSIGSRAFEYCSGLTSVTIPDSVTSIGNMAFYDCSSLKYNEYDNAYYLGNSTNPYVVLVKAKNTSITSCKIHSNTKVIYYEAFEDCSSLTSITIPDSVTSIGELAFSSCSSLTSVTIPYSVTSIGARAFYNCSSLTSITIPDRVTSIGNAAFYNCSSLTSVTIPDSVTSIGNFAFYDCSSLTSITIPDGVTSIGNSAFDYCFRLDTVYYTGTEEEWGEIFIDSGNVYLKNAEIVFNYAP